MQIMGADFSGAKSPDITVAVGTLTADTLAVEYLHACDDRLDMYHHIAYGSTQQLCGLDFPFRLPRAGLAALNLEEHVELHELAFTMSRSQFAAFLLEKLGGYESKCSTASLYCRQTDVECNAYSAVKRVNPSLVQMLYAGSKLLWYLWDDGVMPYPLYVPSRCQVCEVYPSHTWAKVGMKRSTDMRAFVDAFNALGIIHVDLPAEYSIVATQDIADSIVACVTTAAVQARDDIFNNWTRQPSFATDAEWALAADEGLIVRL